MHSGHYLFYFAIPCMDTMLILTERKKSSSSVIFIAFYLISGSCSTHHRSSLGWSSIILVVWLRTLQVGLAQRRMHYVVILLV